MASGSSSSKGITMSDMLNPLYLHPSDGPHTGVISEKLSGPANYKAWKNDMEIALASKRKLGFVTGLVVRDKDSAEKKDQWDTCNSMVIAWLTGSMTPQVKETVRYVKSAKEMWQQLEKRYDLANGTRKYKLNKSLYDLKQGGMSVTEYYSKLKCLWDEIDAMRKYPPITEMNTEICAFVDAMAAEKEQEKLFQLLGGLDDEYAAQRSHILMFAPLPSVDEAYSRLVQEEAQRELSKDSKESFETGAMFTKKEEWCNVCDMKGHSKEKCWRVIGYPEWHPKAKRQGRNEGYQGSSSQGRGWNRGKQVQKPGQNQGNFRGTQRNPKYAGNVKTEDEINFTSEQLEKMMRAGSDGRKGGSETEEEIDHAFAGLSFPDY